MDRISHKACLSATMLFAIVASVSAPRAAWAKDGEKKKASEQLGLNKNISAVPDVAGKFVGIALPAGALQQAVLKKKEIRYSSSSGKSASFIESLQIGGPKNDDLVLFLGDDASGGSYKIKIDILFHNATEAGWVVQFLQQTKQEVAIAFNDTPPLKPIHKPSKDNAGDTDIGNYVISVENPEEIAIAGPKAPTKITVPAAQNADMDQFTDQIRDALVEQCSFTADLEGRMARMKNAARCGLR